MENKKFITYRMSSKVHKIVKAIASLEEKGLQEFIEEVLLEKIKVEYPDVFNKFIEMTKVSNGEED
jgi:translation initiation factor 2 alpha subunit (eIF-2alpha)